ncbi:glycoside hydrolase family 70 protein [Leuconostoc gelidum]|uniref:glycoside hydrolase family 70 protein n=1 Tax=Leuconostoc gelidum TaxID=1244 RepID=UPI001CC58B9E|nr:glycoside hydrolase family 70 protein [Leuconostoc gelidum]
MKNQETTCRKKLYKSGKLWVTAGVSLIIGLGMSVQQVSADTIHSATVKKVRDTSQDVPVAATKKISNIDQNVPVSSNQAKGATDNVQDDTLTQPVSNDLSAQTTVPVSNDKTTIQDSSNSVANQNKNTDSNANTVQAKDSLAVTASVKTSTDVLSTTGPSTTNSNSQPNTDTTNNQVAVVNNQKDNDIATKNTDSVPVKAPTEDQASKATPVKENNQSETKKDSNQYHSKNIQTIDGKTYYIDDNGQAKKNFTTVVDGQVLYFDKETGLLSATNDYQFKQGLTSQNNSFTAHNAVENTTKDNFTEIDGYLTADSWYRPKDILVNGKDWIPSSDKDFRPLLMSWWPDKMTQVNYLNYMKTLGLSNSSVNFSANDDQSILNQASQDIQVKIEQKISQEGQTNWLQHDISDFVDSQSNWNVNSELQTTGNDKDHLQGGALRYVNSDKTPNANSEVNPITWTE